MIRLATDERMWPWYEIPVRLYCSACHQSCYYVEHDDSFSYSYGDINGVHRQSHFASDCCDSEVIEGYDCEKWCGCTDDETCRNCDK
jgi:hypothetical protein